jgi:uncharacterized protein (TIGR02147 family)
MAFSVYSYSDYKLLIKDRVRDLRKNSPKYSMQFLAQELEIQNTFFSKVMNSDQHHLNEDQTFKIGLTLKFIHDEIDYLQLLRSYQASQDKSRQQYLYQRITKIQKSQALSANSVEPSRSSFDEDVRYLMDYYAVSIHVALWIKDFKENPEMLARYFSISANKVFEILKLLDRMGKIEYDSAERKVKKVIASRTHFGKDHPLTRTHQLIMKTYLNQISLNKEEEQKENFFATFTTDQEGFKKIKQQIKDFISQVQATSFAGQHRGLYQLNVDCLELVSLE